MPDDATTANPEWTRRLQSLVDETVARSTASTANFGRLLAAATAPGVGPESWANELARQGTERGPEAYRQLTQVTGRFMSESLRLVAQYLEAYLQELVPNGQAARIGSPPAMPLAPLSSDALAWTAWYQSYATWLTEQQAWSSRLLTVVREEVAAGRLRSDVMQTSARGFLERRLPDYLISMAELNTDLVSDVLGVADDSLERLADALIGDDAAPVADSVVVDVRGNVGSTVAVSLVVENSRPAPAEISCDDAPIDGFALESSPRQFRLDPGGSEPVSIRVALPSIPTQEPVDAGTVTIRGQDERDLVVWIRAEVDALPVPPALAASPAPPAVPEAATPEEHPETTTT
jgi:hypothetical protein